MLKLLLNNLETIKLFYAIIRDTDADADGVPYLHYLQQEFLFLAQALSSMAATSSHERFRQIAFRLREWLH